MKWITFCINEKQLTICCPAVFVVSVCGQFTHFSYFTRQLGIAHEEDTKSIQISKSCVNAYEESWPCDLHPWPPHLEMTSPHLENMTSSPWERDLLTLRTWPHLENVTSSLWERDLLTLRTWPPHLEIVTSSPWKCDLLTLRTRPPHLENMTSSPSEHDLFNIRTWPPHLESMTSSPWEHDLLTLRTWPPHLENDHLTLRTWPAHLENILVFVVVRHHVVTEVWRPLIAHHLRGVQLPLEERHRGKRQGEVQHSASETNVYNVVAFVLDHELFRRI